MDPIRSETVGESAHVLVLHVPVQLVQDAAGSVLEESRRLLPDCDNARLVLDFSSVDLINSVGITCLLQVQDFCRQRGARLLLAGMRSETRRFLRTLALENRFELVDSVEAALAD